MPPPIPHLRSEAGRCWRCGADLSYEVDGVGCLVERCLRCQGEFATLLAEVRRLRRIAGERGGPIVFALAAPAAVPELTLAPASRPRRRCSCGRSLRRRRDGRLPDRCYLCEHGRRPGSH